MSSSSEHEFDHRPPPPPPPPSVLQPTGTEDHPLSIHSNTAPARKNPPTPTNFAHHLNPPDALASNNTPTKRVRINSTDSDDEPHQSPLAAIAQRSKAARRAAASLHKKVSKNIMAKSESKMEMYNLANDLSLLTRPGSNPGGSLPNTTNPMSLNRAGSGELEPLSLTLATLKSGSNDNNNNNNNNNKRYSKTRGSIESNADDELDAVPGAAGKIGKKKTGLGGLADLFSGKQRRNSNNSDKKGANGGGECWQKFALFVSRSSASWYVFVIFSSLVCVDYFFCLFVLGHKLFLPLL